jgi:hypothetical protein
MATSSLCSIVIDGSVALHAVDMQPRINKDAMSSLIEILRKKLINGSSF